MDTQPGVDLYWLPLGAGGRSVRLNGRVFEAVVARLERRPTRDLYHPALVVRLPEGEFTIEMTPVRDGDGALRGVVAEGAVGSRLARPLRLFRYEIRRWRGGAIPDVGGAVDSPRRLTDDPVVAQRLLELVPAVPTPVWGRDELGAGEMWNSNSLVSWLIVRSGLDVDEVRPPPGGRAPGWDAGIVVAGGLTGPSRPCGSRCRGGFPSSLYPPVTTATPPSATATPSRCSREIRSPSTRWASSTVTTG